MFWPTVARSVAFAAGLLTTGAWLSPARAEVVAQVDQSHQRMRVLVRGDVVHDWPVSTAGRGFTTPNGSFRVRRMEPMWRSRRYHGSPMPHALFFRGGYAVHGTDAVRSLGRRASHGCVRLSPANARHLYALALRHGGARVVIRN